MSKKKDRRNEAVVLLRNAGYTLSEIATIVGISRQRAFQIIECNKTEDSTLVTRTSNVLVT